MRAIAPVLSVVFAALLAAVAPTCTFASLDGSTITLVQPSGPVPPVPPLAIQLEFEVQKDDVHVERIVGVWIRPPSVLTAESASMWFDEIVAGRPDFTCSYADSTLFWIDDPDTGGIWRGESTNIGAIAMGVTPEDWPDVLVFRWWLVGELGNDLSGTFLVPTTPVERGTWGRIKALYR